MLLQNLAFCRLQEVRWRESGAKLVTLDTGEKFEFHWSGYKKKREAGVGILIRVHPDIEINTPNVATPRLIAIDIKVHGFNLRVVNCYAPTQVNSTDAQKQLFYAELNKAVAKTEKHQKLLVLGDFNATTALSERHSFFDGIKISTDNKSNDNGQRLKSFCRTHKLCMSSTFFKHRKVHRYTWYSNDGKTRKVIDYVLAEKFVQQYMTDCRVYRGVTIDSDHRLLQATLCTPATRKTRRRFRKYPVPPKRDIKSLLNPSTREKYSMTIDQKLQINPPDRTTTAKFSDDLVQLLKEAADECLPKKSTKEKDNEIWKNDEMLNVLLSERSGYSVRSAEYKAVTKKIKKRVSQLRNIKMQAEANEINTYATKREVEDLFKNFKHDGSTFKNAKHNNGCDAEKLKAFFQAHFSQKINTAESEPCELSEPPEFISSLRDNVFDHIDTKPPKADEIRKTLKALKNGKASVDIPPEFLKYAISSDSLVSELEELFNNIWTGLDIPESWGHSQLNASWKGPSKGSIKDPSSYRGLQIGATMSKILVVIILNRIKDWYDNQLLEQQQGFRRGRGTADGIFVTKRVQQISDKMNKPVFVLFVDLTAAFDHVIREWLFKSIYQRLPVRSNPILIKLLECLYSHTTTALSEDPENPFQLYTGVRQGGPESPPLFNLYLDYVMRLFLKACEEQEIKFLTFNYRVRSTALSREERKQPYHGQHTIDWCGYADDIELMFEDESNMQKALNLLNSIFLKFKLQINVKKTKTMIFNYTHVNKDENAYPKSVVQLDGTPIENVTLFRYLGDEIQFTQPSTGDAEIDLRISVAESKFNQLYKKLTNRNILLKTRVFVLNAIVRSRLTYSCQTWNVNQVQQRRLESAYVFMLRKMIRDGFKRKEQSEPETPNYAFYYSSEDVRHICQTEDIMSYVNRQQTKYLAHVARKNTKSLTKKLLFNDDRNRKKGRPVLTLEDYVLMQQNMTKDQFYRAALKRTLDVDTADPRGLSCSTLAPVSRS